MKIIICFYCMLLILSSCVGGGRNEEIDRLNERVKQLEEKVNSTEVGGSVPFVTDQKDNNLQSGHCKAFTKKGSRCKRKAKGNGYCWQHAG